MVGDDQQWIKDATEIAVAKFGCKPFSKMLFHIPTGGSHDQETFNHEKFETKCAGKLSHPACLCLCPKRATQGMHAPRMGYAGLHLDPFSVKCLVT